MDIFEWALFPKWEDYLRFLATNLAAEESWEYTNKQKEEFELSTYSRHLIPFDSRNCFGDCLHSKGK